MDGQSGHRQLSSHTWIAPCGASSAPRHKAWPKVAADMGVHQNGLLIKNRFKGLNGNETKLKVAFPSNKRDVYGYTYMILDVAYKWASKHHDTANRMSTTRNGIQHN